MRTIHKYHLEITDNIVIKLPRWSKILSIGVQPNSSALGGEQVCLWALVETNNPLEEVYLKMRGTGHDCEGIDAENFIGTVIMAKGRLVFHIFEV
jgi:hypothetical protein